jgi:hypothetical protein
LFKWRHFEPAVIACAVAWYLRFSLSYSNVEELLTERGLPADHTTIWRWVQCYAPELNKRCRRELKPTNGSWRVDETYIRVKGKWTYLYRAVDSTGATIDFLLAARRDAAAAKRFFQKALRAPGHPRPRVINVDTPWNTHFPGVKRRVGHGEAPCRTTPAQCPGTGVLQDESEAVGAAAQSALLRQTELERGVKAKSHRLLLQRPDRARSIRAGRRQAQNLATGNCGIANQPEALSGGEGLKAYCSRPRAHRH